jgi:hypothetical protein
MQVRHRLQWRCRLQSRLRRLQVRHRLQFRLPPL